MDGNSGGDYISFMAFSHRNQTEGKLIGEQDAYSR